MRIGFFAAAALLLGTACNASFAGGTPIQASGVDGQRDFEVGGFERVELAGPFDAQVTVGGAPSVRASGDTGVLEHIEVRVDGNRLRVGLRDGYNWSGEGRINVQVTAPTLSGAAIAGSGDMRVSPVQAQSFAGSIAGSGNLVIERLQTENAEFEIAGSGDIEAAGAARQASVAIAGSGNARLGGLQSEGASVSIAGSGDADLHATGTASVRILGSGNVAVRGGARCDVSKMGSGEVNCS